MSFFQRRLDEGLRDPEFRAGYLETCAELMFDISLNSEAVVIYEPASTEFSVTLCSPGVLSADQPVVAPQLQFSSATVAA